MGLKELFDKFECEIDRLTDENARLREDLSEANHERATMAVQAIKQEHTKMKGKHAGTVNLGDGEGEGGEDADSDLEAEASALDDRLSLSLSGGVTGVTGVSRRDALHATARHRLHKLGFVQKRLKRCEHELAEALEELCSYRKKDRQYDIHRRGAEETMRRVGHMQRQLDAKNHEMVRTQLLCAQHEGKLFTVQSAMHSLEHEHKQLQERHAHLESLKARYAEQLACVRKQVSRESILNKLPPLPSGRGVGVGGGSGGGEGTGKGEVRVSLGQRKIQSAAAELCRRIKKEPGISARVEAMLDRLVLEVGLHVEERHVLARREAILLQMLTGEGRRR